MAKKKVTHHSKDQPKQPPPAEALQNPHHRVTDSTNATTATPGPAAAPPKTTTAAAPKPAATAASAMEESSEKVQSLKCLNTRLLKEAYEGRQQIDSLVLAKDSLQAELTRSGLEKKVLETELTRASELSVGLELEKGVFGVFLEAQMKGGESEIGSLKKEVREIMGSLENERESLVRVCEERDVLRRDFDGLKKRVREAEKSGRLAKEEVEKLRVKCEGMSKGKEERERAVEGLKKEKVLAEGKLVESGRLVEKLKSENVKIADEKSEADRIKSELEQKIGVLEKEMGRKNEIMLGLRGEVEALQGRISVLEKSIDEGANEAERNLAESERLVERFKSEREKIWSEKNEAERIKSELEVQIGVLEKEVGQKNEIVLDLRREVEVMRAKISGMESFIAEGMKEMEMEVLSLKEEKDAKEKNIEKLQERLYGVESALIMSEMEVSDEMLQIEELIRKKSEIEEAKVNQENEIAALHNEVSELRDAQFALRNSCRDYVEKSKQLLSEVDDYKDAVERVTLERNKSQKAFNEERENVERLKLVIMEKDKMVQEITGELCVLKKEQESLLGNAKATKSRLESLVKERDSAQKSLLEVQNRMEEWRARVESAGVNYEKVLSMLKKTASKISSAQSEHVKRELVIDNVQKLEGEAQAYVSELEAIEKAFKVKEKMVENVKNEVESLKRSEAEAHKRKSFWTLVSSATTVLAAASVAYAAMGR